MAVTIPAINRAVCKHYNVTLTDLHLHSRTVRLVRPRQVAMFLARTYTKNSFPEIGRRMGGKDHTSVFYAVRKISELSMIDPVLSRDLDELRGVLGV
jgi:chromosomal replication initiator protein